MSYILDALRRLEQEKEKTRMTANPIQAVLQGGGPSERTPREGWRGRTHWPWLPTGLLLLFLALGVTFWVARSTAPVRKEAGPTLPSLPPSVAARGPFPDTGGSSVKGPEPSRLRPGAGDAPASGVSRLSPLSASPPSERLPIPSLQADPPAVHTAEPPARRPAGPAPVPEEVLVSKPEPVRDGVAAPAAPRRAPQPAPAHRLSEPPPTRLSAGETGLRISAIVWSPNRENRFAVVNMKTVHEGDFVDDDKVLEIGQDEVVFEKAGRRFSVGVGKR